MNKELTDFVKDRYPIDKSDFAVFMERTLEMTHQMDLLYYYNVNLDVFK